MRAALLCLLLCACAAGARAQRPARPYTVARLADGVYLFSAYFYSSLFVVTGQGVIATDPISPRVAQLYAQAIEGVTDQPVRYVIYSHDHTDHVAGGAVFAGTAQFVAQENARANIIARGDPDIVVPQITFRDHYEIKLGGREVRLLYFGENHSDSNVAIYLPAEKILMMVDMVYPGSVPFRDLPGTDVRKYLGTLRRLREIDFKILLYGHGSPGTKQWVDQYIAYFDDLIAEVRRLRRELSYEELVEEQQGRGDVRGLFDLYVERVAERAVETLRPKYGRWGGFDEWAIMNARRIVLYLIMDG
ncbi:MAG: MBL fold metallo-hydrolase [Acidobacteria bacterium]|nr:MBL fold metallo-hydrolase [Acidobacteriota bacterium]